MTKHLFDLENRLLTEELHSDYVLLLWEKGVCTNIVVDEELIIEEFICCQVA